MDLLELIKIKKLKLVGIFKLKMLLTMVVKIFEISNDGIIENRVNHNFYYFNEVINLKFVLESTKKFYGHHEEKVLNNRNTNS